MPFFKYTENWILFIFTFLVIAGVTFRIFKPAPKIPKHDGDMKFVYALIAIHTTFTGLFLYHSLTLRDDGAFVLLSQMSLFPFQIVLFTIPCIVVIYIFRKDKITRKQKTVLTILTFSLAALNFYFVNLFLSNYEPFDLHLKSQFP